MTGPIFDRADDGLVDAVTLAMGIDFTDPVKAMFRDMLCELALRVREVRHHCKFEATEHNGHHWVRADRILELMGDS